MLRTLFLALFVLIGPWALAQPCGDLPVGALDTCFKATGFLESINTVVNTISAVYELPGSKILVAGNFLSFANSRINSIAQLLPNGDLDTSVSILDTPNPGIFSYNTDISDVVFQPDGKMITISEGLDPWSGGVIRFNADMTYDSTFRIRQVGDSIIYFTQIIPNYGGGLLGIGRNIFDPYFLRIFYIDMDGTHISSNIKSKFSENSTKAYIDQNMRVLCIYKNAVRGGITRHLNGGAPDTLFNKTVEHNPYLSGINSPYPAVTINTIALDTNGKIYLGGWSGWNGYPSQRSIFCRLNTNGTIDSTYQIGGFTGSHPSISDILLQENGALIVVGTFTGYLGDSVPGICRLLPSGQIDRNFDPGTGINFPDLQRSAPVRIKAVSDSTAYIYGNYQSYNGSGTPYLNRISIKPRGVVTSTPGPKPGVMPSISLVPNPTSGNLTIRCRGYSGPVFIYDRFGRTMLQFQMASGSIITDVSSLQAGVYVLRCGQRQAKLVRQ